MKLLKSALVSVALTLAPLTAAFAGTVDFNFGRTDIKGISNFADAWSFSLAADALVSGQILTVPKSSEQPWVNIQSAFLVKEGGGAQINLLETVGVDWGGEDDPFGVETWTFAAQWLTAGDWELHVNGRAYNSKLFEGYEAKLNATVPEPASLGLAAVALGSLVLVRRRKASAAADQAKG